MKKRGLSDVVTSLIMILLVLVAIGIVWVIVNNILTKNSEQISITPFTNDIKIEEAKIGLTTAKVSVTKIKGEDNITSLKFSFIDGNRNYNYEQTQDLPKLFETKNYNIQLENGISANTKIIITPMYGKRTGIEKEIQATEDYSSGEGNGLIVYALPQEQTFNGVDDYVDLGNLGNFGSKIANSSVSVWIKTIQTSRMMAVVKIIEDTTANDPVDPVYSIEINRGIGSNCASTSTVEDKLLFYIRDNNAPSGKIFARSAVFNNINDGEWHHIFWNVIDATNNDMQIYIDEQLIVSSDEGISLCSGSPSQFPNWIRQTLYIGAGNQRGIIGNPFDGQIKKVAIFNRSLSDAEINQIYLSQK